MEIIPFFSTFRSWTPQFCSVLFCSMFLSLILLPFGGHYRTLFAVQFRILLLLRLNCIHFPFTAAVAAAVVATQLPTYIPFLFLLPLNTKEDEENEAGWPLYLIFHIGLPIRCSMFAAAAFSCHRRPGETCIFFLLVICNAAFSLSLTFVWQWLSLLASSISPPPPPPALLLLSNSLFLSLPLFIQFCCCCSKWDITFC